MTSDEWIAGFTKAMEGFIAERPVAACSVRMEAVGEIFMVKWIAPGPLPGTILIDPYPKNMATMVTSSDGLRAGLAVTPSRMMISIGQVAKVEFLVEPPGARSMGFGRYQEPDLPPE